MIGRAFEAIDASSNVAQLERAIIDAGPLLIDAAAYGITWLEPDRRTRSVRALGVPPGFPEQYDEFGRENDSLFRYAAAESQAVHDRVLFDRRTWPQEPVGAFLHDWGFERCLQAPVTAGGVLHTMLHFTRAPGARPFAARDRHAAELLGHRVGRQLRSMLTERELGRTRILCAALLEHLPVPAVVCTARAELVQMNRAAELLLICYRGDPALWPEYATAVRAAIDATTTGTEAADTSPLARRDRDEPGYRVRVNRVETAGLFVALFHPERPQPNGAVALAAREQVIANLVAQGYTNERIAATLSISVNTVKDHLKRINRKLGTTNRAQVAAWAQATLATGRRDGVSKGPGPLETPRPGWVRP